MNRLVPLRRRVGRLLVVGGLVVGLLAVLGTTVQIPWLVRATSSLEGRAPAACAVAFAEVGATLSNIIGGDATAQTSCTAPNGYVISWDSDVQRCVVECAGTKSIVATVQWLGTPVLMTSATRCKLWGTCR